MIKYLITEIPIYERPLVIIDCENLDEVEKFFPSNIFTNDKELPLRGYSCRLWIDDKNDPEELVEAHCVMLNTTKEINVGDIAHECIHIKNQVYKSIGAVSTVGNDEHEAYLVGWLVDIVYKFLSSNKNDR